MKHMPACAVIALAVLVGGGCSAKKSPDEELKKLEGEWTVSELNEKGKTADKAKLKRLVASFAEGKFQMLEVSETKGETKVGAPSEQLAAQAVQLDVSKEPYELELVVLQGDDAGKSRPGIFALEGDTLRICIGDLGGTRPTGFSAGASSTLMVLERKK